MAKANGGVRGGASRGGGNPLKVISYFNKNYTVELRNEQTGAKEKLSNLAGGLTENVRKQKFPFLDNTGTTDKDKALRYIFGSVLEKGFEAPATTINVELASSGLNNNRLFVVSQKDPVEIRITDPNSFKNPKILTIKKNGK